MVWRHRGGALDVSRARVMGILNVTPDSFSDGGRYTDTDAALAHAREMAAAGAAIIDVGGQSTRPGHTPVDAEEEWARLAPVLRALAADAASPDGALRGVAVSVDTYYPAVAERALAAGAHIINDVSGDLTGGMPEVAAAHGAGLVLMHAGGGSAERAGHKDVAAVGSFFADALAAAEAAGLPRACVCLDPGLGFGSSDRADGALVGALGALTAAFPDVPVLVGGSRKRVIGTAIREAGERVIGTAIKEAGGADTPAAERLAGTLALHSIAQWNGARILRVHDVAAAVQAARMVDYIKAVVYG